MTIFVLHEVVIIFPGVLRKWLAWQGPIEACDLGALDSLDGDRGAGEVVGGDALVYE